ncbi:MAG: NADH-quinone oxidoreductase subunit C [Euryarchaeota archaeon]|nr:NADH-quinone oxidoreductase subunit C [Euryarchaeota archaeon]
MEAMTPEEIVDAFKRKFDADVLDIYAQRKKAGIRGETKRAWVRIALPRFRDAVRFLCTLQDHPHLSVISGQDLGKEVELIYHFSIFYGRKLEEVEVMIAVRLPKEDLVVPTITDMIPGAVVHEREQQDMLGVKVEGIPDPRRIFLPDDFPEGLYPLRLDKTGIPDEHKIVRKAPYPEEK